MPDLAIQVQKRTDIVYATVGGEELKLDLFVPTNYPGPLAAIVFLHGGGWCFGAKEDMREFEEKLSEYGYLTLSVGYRLAPRHHFPAQLDDVQCAVRWLRTHAAEYHLDPDRIGAAGVSAGGHLALLLGVTQGNADLGPAALGNPVRAVVSIMGPTDLSCTGWPTETEKVLTAFVGRTRNEIPTAFRAASPRAYVRADSPAALLVHGTSDAIVPYEQAQSLHASLRAAGVESWLETLPGKGHGFDWTAQDWLRIRALMVQFFDRHLKAR